MSDVFRSSRPGFGGTVAAIVRIAAHVMRQIMIARRNRREVAMLLHAEPGMLRDLGLSRSDVAVALGEPMWRDPSARLLIWSVERRAAARAAARDNIQGLAPQRALSPDRAAENSPAILRIASVKCD